MKSLPFGKEYLVRQALDQEKSAEFVKKMGDYLDSYAEAKKQAFKRAGCFYPTMAPPLPKEMGINDWLREEESIWDEERAEEKKKSATRNQ